jgi:glycosyltransferase 2 family protein
VNTTLHSDPVLDQPTAPLLEEPPEPIQRRLLRPHTIASFVIAIAIIGFLIQRLDINLNSVWMNIRAANPWYFGAALALYYLTFVARTYRWRYMLNQAGDAQGNGWPMPSIPHLFEILMLSWFANCVVPAKLGDGYRSYLLKRDAGTPASVSLGTILAERLTDLSVLFLTMTAAGIFAFHGDLPTRVQQTVLIGGGLMFLAAIGLIVLFFAREYVQRYVPARFVRQYDDFHGAVFACLRRPALPVAVSIGIWAADGFRLFFVAKSLGADLTITLTIFVALMSALLTTLPITPAGLGVVEAAVVVVLKLVDVDADLASSIAILDRVIGYWSLIAVGIVLYMHRLRRDVQTVRSE